jgi:hypothetical protein
MTDEMFFDLKKIDESAERIVLGGLPVQYYRKASIDRKDEREFNFFVV